MKRTYIKFPCAPAIVSRRSGIHSHVTVARKSDAPDGSDEAKAAVEQLTKEVKSYVESNDKLAKDLETSQKEAKSAKEEAEAAKKAAEDTQKEVKELKEAAVKRDEADKKNQEALNKLVAERKQLGSDRRETKSFGDVLTKSLTEATDDLNKFANKEIKSFSIEVKDAADMTTSNVTGGSRYGQIMAPGIRENAVRKIHLRDLLSVGNIGSGNSYTHMRENGTGEGNPAPVAEGNLKPLFDMDLIENTVQIETIAGLVKFTRKAMKNIPGFISWLQRRMPQRLLNVEDYQILYGDGATPNLKGLFHADNHKASTSTAPILVEAIIDDIARLEDDFEREATGIAMRPIHYYSFFKNKADGSGEYDLPQGVQFSNGILYILGVPVAPTTALNKENGDYVVGDFQMGAELLIQEGMRIEFFEQDGDNVQRNKVTARIEENVAFPVYGDNFFIKGTVPAE